jgi:hypothetical protein
MIELKIATMMLLMGVLLLGTRLSAVPRRSGD